MSAHAMLVVRHLREAAALLRHAEGETAQTALEHIERALGHSKEVEAESESASTDVLVAALELCERNWSLIEENGRMDGFDTRARKASAHTLATVRKALGRT